MKTKMVKRLTASLTAVLFVAAMAPYALAASAKGQKGMVACHWGDENTIAELKLTAEQVAKIDALCALHLQGAIGKPAQNTSIIGLDPADRL